MFDSDIVFCVESQEEAIIKYYINNYISAIKLKAEFHIALKSQVYVNIKNEK